MVQVNESPQILHGRSRNLDLWMSLSLYIEMVTPLLSFVTLIVGDAKIKPLLRQSRALPSFVPNINILYSGKSSEDQPPKTKLIDDVTRLTSRAEVSPI